MKNGDKPAYPVEVKASYESGSYTYFETGLSKREKIAVEAMQGMLSNGNFIGRASFDADRWRDTVSEISKFATRQADALLSELEKQQP